tara:strand:- start:803 stop:1177 length:375 start_codon:yes stop_codon:yes gene_type:complete
MFSFITIGTNNLKRAGSFYDKVLKPLKIQRTLTHNRYFGYSRNISPNKIELYLIKPHNKKRATVGNGTMVTFIAKSRKVVEDFYKIGIKLGAKSEGVPGPRHGKDYYAYIRDPDGNKICVFKKI